MKTSIIIAIATLITTVSAVSAAEAQPSTQSAKQRKTVQQNILAKYDANHDGVLSAEEKQAMRKIASDRKETRLAKFDKNNDGKLDRAERRAARNAERKERAAHN
jgi:hypothetical protein